MTEIVISIGTKILEYLVEPILIRPLRPVFCYRSIVDDFRDTHTRLRGIRERVGNKVQEARNNVQVIHNGVEKWVEDVDAVMSEVRHLESRLEENRSCSCNSWCPNWSCHRQFSKKVLRITATMKTLCEDGSLFNSVSHPPTLHQDIIGSSSSVSFVHSNSSKSAFDQIMEALKRNDINLIGLYGEAGTGKTTLAKQVGEEAKKLFNRVILISVSQHPQVRSMQGFIADFLDLPLKQLESDQGRAAKLQLRLKNGEKILIILDDVQKEFNLRAVIGIPSSHNGCKILLTAHAEIHVLESMHTQKDIQLGALSEDEAWTLFKNIAGVGDEVRMHGVAKDALAQCNSLPKAIVAMGMVLNGRSVSEWREILEQLNTAKFLIIDSLKEDAKKLSLREDRVKTKIKMAKKNDDEIYHDVEKWLEDVERVMNDVEQFENELNKNKWCFDERELKTKVAALAIFVNDLYAESHFDQVSYPVPLVQDMELLPFEDFMFSNATKSAFNQVMEALDTSGINMIGLYGMGGIGKTTLANQVQNEVLKKHIFDCALMVTVSQKPDVEKMQDEIADFLNLELKEKTVNGRASKLKHRLKNEKILVILDDIWKPFDLRTIGITLNDCKGCAILVTTRRRDVCSFMNCQHEIQLHLFSEVESQKFFQKKAGLSNKFELDDVSKQIVEECKCLPIALETVGAALKKKGSDEWIEALEKLRNSRLVDVIGADDDEKNAYKCLRLSYDYLKGQTQAPQTQFILLLCSLFPEDHKIEVEDLTRYAFGLELFERVRSIEDVRRKVRVIIGILKDSCLLLDTEGEQYVKIHDVVRDAMLWIGSMEPQERNVLTVRNNIDLKDLIKKKSFQNCRAVSFMSDVIPKLSKYNKLEFPNVEVVIFFSNGEDDFVIELGEGFFEHMKSLKVLDVRGARRWSRCKFSMPQSLHSLEYLHTLMLRYCECFNSSILRELTRLEILSLNSCVVDCGVEVVSGLKKLRLLDLSDLRAEKRIFASNVIETFRKLEELHGYLFAEFWDEGTFSSLYELKLLPNLVALSVRIEDLSCIPTGFSFPDLRSYFIRMGAGGYRPELWPEYLGQGRRLELRDIIEDVTVVTNTCKKLLPTVQDLYVEGCEDLCSLNAFNSHADRFLHGLESLIVKECYKMEWVFEFQVSEDVHNMQLQFLKILKLKQLWELKHVWKGPTRLLSLCNLTQVKIVRCLKIKCVFSSPSFARSLLQLKILIIKHCHDLEEIISRRGDSDDGGDDFSCCCCLTNLRELEVYHCYKVKTIFPIVKSTGRAPHLHPQSRCRLPNLKSIDVQINSELEHIFGHQTQAEEGVECPSLQVLEVTGCPKISTTHFATTQLQAPFRKLLKDNNIRGVEEQLQRRDDELSQNRTICFSSLTRVELTGCRKLKQVFTMSLATNFHQLKVLVIQKCNELEQVISKVEDGEEGPTIRFRFENLKTLHVSKCRKLKRIFPVVTSLHQLEELILQRCNQLEQVIARVEDGREGSVIGVSFANLKTLEVSECGKLKTIFPISIALPKLERLRLERNAEMEHVFGRSDWDCTWQCPLLKKLCVMDCPKMCRQFGASIPNLSTAKEMKKIKLGHAQGVEELIQVQRRGNNLLISLKTLSLWNLEELKCIWRGPTDTICLANLWRIKVVSCNRLKHVFTTVAARNLPKLKQLIIRRCNELEQVIVVEDGEEEREDDRNAELTAKVGFMNLEVLHVSKCEKLKTIFSMFIPLPKLDCLRLKSNAELESVFGQSHCDCTSQWACLKVLSVTGCPKLCTQIVAILKGRIQGQSATKQLEIINLSGIQGVEELVQFQRKKLQLLKLEEVADLKRIWSEPTQNKSFSHLTGVRVIGCNRLKQLFTSSMAKTLRELRLLAVERCHDLQQIIQEEDGYEGDSIKSLQRLKFSSLEILRLMDLPKLVSFCPSSCNLVFTSLKEKNLKVEGCPKHITEFFSKKSYKQDDKDECFSKDDEDKDEDDDSYGNENEYKDDCDIKDEYNDFEGKENDDDDDDDDDGNSKDDDSDGNEIDEDDCKDDSDIKDEHDDFKDKDDDDANTKDDDSDDEDDIKDIIDDDSDDDDIKDIIDDDSNYDNSSAENYVADDEFKYGHEDEDDSDDHGYYDETSINALFGVRKLFRRHHFRMRMFD